MKFGILGSYFLVLSFASSKTVFEFSRPVNTCDDADVSLDGTTKLVWAYNDNDPRDNDPSKVMKHQHKGGAKVHFGAGNMEPNLEANTKYVDLVAPNFEVPCCDRNTSAPSTLYYSTGRDLWEAIPEADENHEVHITKFEMVFDPANREHIHHLLFEPCADGLNEEDLLPENWGETAINVPKALEKCYLGSNTLFAWTLGGRGQAMPPDAGIRIGGNSKFRYFMVELHYDLPWYEAPEGANEDWQPDHLMRDNSGMRIYYTTTLRPHDMSQIFLGQEIDPDSHFIPAGQPDFVTTAVAYPGCNEDIWPESGEITISQIMLHGHDWTTKIVARHIRDGVELPPIAVDMHYDNYYQQYIDVDVVWKKDDYIILDCYTDTTSSDKPVHGGLATGDEMCQAFWIIYPDFTAPSELYFSVDERSIEPGQFLDKCTNTTYQLPEYTPYVEPEKCAAKDEIIHPARGNSEVSSMSMTTFDRSKYQDSFYLDPAWEGGQEKFKLFFSMHRELNVVDMAIEVDTDGWVGLGFSPNGGMKNADMIIGWVCDKTGEAFFHDRYASREALPSIDINQDYFDICGMQDGVEYNPRAQMSPLPVNEDHKSSNMGMVYDWRGNPVDPDGGARYGETASDSDSKTESNNENMPYGDAYSYEPYGNAKYNEPAFDTAMNDQAAGGRAESYTVPMSIVVIGITLLVVGLSLGFCKFYSCYRKRKDLKRKPQYRLQNATEC